MARDMVAKFRVSGIIALWGRAGRVSLNYICCTTNLILQRLNHP